MLPVFLEVKCCKIIRICQLSGYFNYTLVSFPTSTILWFLSLLQLYFGFFPYFNYTLVSFPTSTILWFLSLLQLYFGFFPYFNYTLVSFPTSTILWFLSLAVIYKLKTFLFLCACLEHLCSTLFVISLNLLFFLYQYHAKSVSCQTCRNV